VWNPPSAVLLFDHLTEFKIFFPPEWFNDATAEIIMSVDGTHCPIFEPQHPTMSMNPEYYSHKFHRAGVNYEIGVSLFTSRVVWVNGPFPAGHNDMKIFREQGLMDAIPPGKLITGDKGYRGLPHLISTSNPRDPEELRLFKRRARARHESFNKRIKDFKCLQNCFRHGVDNHQAVFFAVCVVVQFQMENGSPLFDL
jgi:DDE superfamily endonuclease